jgi:hypothetical protein
MYVKRTRTLIQVSQYSERDHVACMDEMSFWRGETSNGNPIEVELRYNGPIWVLYVWEVQNVRQA